jgi:NADH-quinone oxidoreductase subunit M
MGGVGLFRLASSFSFFESFNITSYLLLSLVLCSLVCSVQSDFKRLVAYSSVVHMMVAMAALFSFYKIGFASFVLIMLTHGITSPMLFNLVGIVYSVFGTRLLFLLRGILRLLPVLALFLVICFVFSVPVPPSPSFLAEVQFVASVLSDSSVRVVIFLFVFLAVLYNLVWLGSILGPCRLSSFSLLSVRFADLFTLSVFGLIMILVLFCFYVYKQWCFIKNFSSEIFLFSLKAKC